MNTPVSPPLAKLLKEKGFDVPVRNYYLIKEKCKNLHEGFEDNYWGDNRIVNWNAKIVGIKPFEGFVSAPTISEVVMWLYKKCGIWVSVSTSMNVKPDFSKPIKGSFGFSYTLNQTTEKAFIKNYNKSIIWGKGFNSPEEAYEASFMYCLTKLKLDI